MELKTIANSIEIRQNCSVEEMFGRFPKLRAKSGQELKEEMRKGWE